MSIYLIIDIGTSGITSVLYNEQLESEQVLKLPQKPDYLNTQVTQAVRTWDKAIDAIFTHTQSVLKKTHQTLSGIFLSSQRSSLICLDENFEPLMDAIMWEDKRASEIVNQFQHHQDEILEKTGSYLSAVYLAPKILLVKSLYPNIYKQVHKFVSIADYVGLKLTGILKTDYTYASRTGLFNIQEKKWDTSLLDLFKIDVDTLCDLEKPGVHTSYLKDELATKYGLGENIPFVSCGGDQNVSAMGLGAFKENRLTLTLGTGGYMQSVTKTYKHQHKLLTNVSPLDGVYLVEGAILSAASMLNYHHRTFFENLSAKEFYALLSKLTTHKTELLHYPFYQGRGTPKWDDKAKGAYVNLSFASTKEDMLLSVVESILFEIKNNLETYQEIGIEVEEIVVAGGIAHNHEILQLLASVLEVSIKKSAYGESTCVGAYLIGRKALDEAFDLEKNFHDFIESKSILIQPKPNPYLSEKYKAWKAYDAKLN